MKEEEWKNFAYYKFSYFSTSFSNLYDYINTNVVIINCFIASISPFRAFKVLSNIPYCLSKNKNKIMKKK